MFNNLIQFPIESDLLKWSAKQVVRDIHNKPTLFYRIKISGTYFPLRAVEPYIKIGEVKSKFAYMSEDSLEVKGYFYQNISQQSNEPIEFGYGEEKPLLRIKRRFVNDEIKLLDLRKLKVKPINLDVIH